MVDPRQLGPEEYFGPDRFFRSIWWVLFSSEPPFEVTLDAGIQIWNADTDYTKHFDIFFQMLLKHLKIVLHMNSLSCQSWVAAFVLVLKDPSEYCTLPYWLKNKIGKAVGWGLHQISLLFCVHIVELLKVVSQQEELRGEWHSNKGEPKPNVRWRWDRNSLWYSSEEMRGGL